MQEAIDEVNKIEKSGNTENVKVGLERETDYYYAIYHEYVDHRKTGDEAFKYIYIFFKKEVFDASKLIINLNIANNKEKIKEILNMYSYISVVDNWSVKIMEPNIHENSSQYEYSYYYFMTSFGDWGLRDNIKLYKKTIVINKATGKFQINDEKIKEVEGKQN